MVEVLSHKEEDKLIEEAWRVLAEVQDPEIPVLTVLDMGIVRDIRFSEGILEVDITPTYSGCPAMNEIESDIAKKIETKVTESYKVNTVLSPAWTTDWLTEEGKQKLLDFGISPPQGKADKSSIWGSDKEVVCPHCKSSNTSMVSQFGSTACKALYRCDECKEPFDYFKCI